MTPFARLMRLFAGIYCIGGILFFFFEPIISKILFIDPAPNRFWNVLTISMMAMLMYLSWQSSRYPNEKSHVICHLLAKSVSVVGFLYSYIVLAPLGAYLVGITTDLSIIIIIATFYWKYNDSTDQPAQMADHR